MSKEVWDGTADGVLDFGHEWNLRLDFNKKDTRVNRILLSSAQSARVAPEEFQRRLHSDLLQFIHVEGQLTDLYGEPEYRFFLMTSRKEKYMFQSGAWDIQQMLSVCENYRVFHSFSIRENVVLETWIDALNHRYADKPLSRVMLSYHPDRMPTPDPPIAQFPPSRGD